MRQHGGQNHAARLSDWRSTNARTALAGSRTGRCHCRARTVAVRGTSSSSAISPITSPVLRTASRIGRLPDAFRISSSPELDDIGAIAAAALGEQLLTRRQVDPIHHLAKPIQVVIRKIGEKRNLAEEVVHGRMGECQSVRVSECQGVKCRVSECRVSECQVSGVGVSGIRCKVTAHHHMTLRGMTPDTLSLLHSLAPSVRP